MSAARRKRSPSLQNRSGTGIVRYITGKKYNTSVSRIGVGPVSYGSSPVKNTTRLSPAPSPRVKANEIMEDELTHSLPSTRAERVQVAAPQTRVSRYTMSPLTPSVCLGSLFLLQ